MVEINPDAHCTYREIDDGIYEMTFHTATRQTVDEMIQNIQEIMDNTPDGAVVRCLIDNSNVDTLPLKYLFGRSAQFFKENANRPRTRLAAIADGKSFKNVIASFVETMSRGDHMRYFNTDEREKAIAWLRRND